MQQYECFNMYCIAQIMIWLYDNNCQCGEEISLLYSKTVLIVLGIETK